VKGLRIAFESKSVFPRQPGFATYLPHTGIQCLLSRMPKRRMAQIMRESGRFSQFRRETMIKKWVFHKQVVGDGPRDLRNLYTMRQACAVEIRLSDAENLSFSLKSAEGAAVQNAVPIPFRGMTVIFGGGRILMVSTLQQKIVHKRKPASAHPGAPIDCIFS
jgi:hypothetical protein